MSKARGWLAAITGGRRGLRLTFVAAASLAMGLSWVRYSRIHHHTFDLALYARMAWGFVHADMWSPIVDAHSLGVHVSAVMGPLAVLGWAFGYVPVLLLAQATAFAACVFPLSRLSVRNLGPAYDWLGPAVWLAYPNLWHVTTYEFHPSNLAVLPLCYAADALDRRDTRGLLGYGAMALACREDLGIAVLLLGLAMSLRTRSARGLYTLCLGLLGLGLGVAIMGAVTSSNGSSLNQHFGAWGGSPLGFARALLGEPGRVWQHIREPRTLLYLPMVLAPLAFLPLRAPVFLLPAMGTLALNLISTFPTTTHFYSHYLTPAVPALVSASIVGLGRASAGRRGRARMGLLACLGVAHVLAGGSPLSMDFPAQDFVADGRTLAGRAVLARVPEGQSAQAPAPLLPHLIERHDIRRAPPPETGARWVVLDLSHRERFAHTETLLRTSEEPAVRRWLARDDHTPVWYASPYLLLERRPFDRHSPALSRYYVSGHAAATPPITPLCECLALSHARIERGELVLALRATGPCPRDLALRFGPQERPTRVELLFDGVLSPAQLKAGDRLVSRYPLRARESGDLQREGLWVGALVRQGTPPGERDPVSVRATLED